DARSEKADRVFDIALGVKYTLRRTCRPAGRAAYDAADPGLGAEQQPRRVFSELFGRRKGQVPQPVEAAQTLREAAVKAAALLFPSQQLVQTAQLYTFKRFPVQAGDALEPASPGL